MTIAVMRRLGAASAGAALMVGLMSSSALAQDASAQELADLRRMVQQQAAMLRSMQSRLSQLEASQRKTGARPGQVAVGAGAQTVAQAPAPGQTGAQVPATAPQSVNQGASAGAAPQGLAQAPPIPSQGSPALPVLSGNDRVKVTLSGQVNRDVILHADHTGRVDSYFADNNVSSTRLRALGAAALDDRTTVVSALEFDLRSNSSGSITRQSENNNGGDSPVLGPFRVRRAEVGVQSKDYGAVLLGRGSSFSDGIAEIDLSGTDVAIYSYAPDSWGAEQFSNKASPQRRSTDPSISQVFDDFDGPRDDRIRYDTPAYNGLSFGGTIGQGYFWDVGTRYEAQLNDIKLAAGLAYQNFNSTTPSADLQDGTQPAYVPFKQRVAGSAAVLFPSGINFVLSGGWGDHIRNCCTTFGTGDIASHDAGTWFGKVGYQAHIFSFGTTNISFDGGQTYNRVKDGDVATRVGFEINQPVVRSGVEVYLAYEHLMLRRSGADLLPGEFALVGSRVRF